jgi:hypothetical protein
MVKTSPMWMVLDSHCFRFSFFFSIFFFFAINFPININDTPVPIPIDINYTPIPIPIDSAFQPSYSFQPVSFLINYFPNSMFFFSPIKSIIINEIPINIQIPIMFVCGRWRLDDDAQRQQISYGMEMDNIYEYDVELLIFHHVKIRCAPTPHMI